MENTNARLSPEIEDFISAVQKGKGLSDITSVVEAEVQRQLEMQLAEFQSCIAQSNLDAIEVMRGELERVKQESETVAGVIEKLKAAVAPDLQNPQEEVVGFRQAIENLQRYGTIIPTGADIIGYQVAAKQNHAWSLMRQSLIKLFINKLERFLSRGNRTIS
ncbi:hypothetical protein ACE1AT_04765 [Pelatocladus sp. BLCC-F211]|uniref:hypothetical protein n=1 Tax=Pelatocladus sp. BLCC-F211 TaxID=3342752 RepID=UPI0035B82D84